MRQLHYRTCHLDETRSGVGADYDGENIIAMRGDTSHMLKVGGSVYL